MVVEVLRDAAKIAVGILYVVGLALIPFVLARRKEPASAIAWILMLVFLPPVGAVLFLMFGRDRVRWPAKKKREVDAMVRASLGAPKSRKDLPEIAGASDLEKALFKIGESLTGLSATTGNDVVVLTDGNAAYDAIGAAIDGAKHHVHAEYYLVRDDATGRWFRERLIAAAERGVKVRLLLDGFGCLGVGPIWRHPLKKAGVEIGEFQPMRTFLVQPVNLRNHRKIVVVDGETAFTGGLNIGDEYRGQMKGLGGWRDLHVRLRGPAAGDLQRVFFQDWTFATGKAVDPDGYFPDVPRAGDATIAIVPSGPDTRTEAIHHIFFGAIAGAAEDVLITTPYFVPTESLVVALSVTSLRGVDVKLLLPSKSNHAVTFYAGRSFYAPLLEAGVDIVEYQPGIVHAKTVVVDRKVCLVGSANMDLRSFRLNFEVHTLIHDAKSARALCAAFESDLKDCVAIDGEAWKKRAWTARVKEGAARLVSPLL